MRIAIVSRGVPDSQNLMNGLFELDQAKALVASGVEVKLLVVDLRSIRRWRHWGMSHEIKDGVECYKISVPVGNVPDIIFCSVGVGALKCLYRYAYRGEDKPDIIHGHFTRQGFMASKLASEIEVPLIVTEHSSVMNQEHINDVLKKIAKETYTAAKVVIAVSSPLANSIKDKTGIESTIVPNIVDTALFTPNLDRKTEQSMFTFVSVGGLIQRKRMDILIRAFSRVHRKYSNTKLVIFGRGEEERNIQKIVEEENIKKNVVLRGLVKRNEIANEFKVADAFVLFSERETFGVAYIEALAAGLPVIATRCQGPEDFMREEFGCLIDVDNIEQAVEAMFYIYENKELFSSERISRIIKDLFSPKTIADRLIKIYEENM